MSNIEAINGQTK